MTDFSRMFPSKPAAVVVERKTKVPDYGSMFPQKAVVGPSLRFKRPEEILEWRRDLSDKVREHVDLVERLVRNDANPVAHAEEVLRTLSNDVAEHVEKSGRWTIFKKADTSPEIETKVRTELDKLAQDLPQHRKADPFRLVEVDKMLEQATYLSEQLAKAGAELDKYKTGCTDVVEIDMINRRCATLFTQQQLVAIGAEQVKQLAADIRTRPTQIDDLLCAAIPMTRKLCLDVLSGTKQASDLRKRP